jgi:hypothetical protein
MQSSGWWDLYCGRVVALHAILTALIVRRWFIAKQNN